MKLAGFAVVVWLLWASVDWAEAWALLRQADPAWLALAVGALTLQTLLSTQRWRVTAGQLGLSIPRADAVREYYLAQAVNQSLPGGVAGDAGRAVRARAQAGLAISAQAVIYERLAGQLGLICVLAVGLALPLLAPVGITWPEWLMGPIALILAVAAALPVLAIAIQRLCAPQGRLHRVIADFGHAVFGHGVRVQQIGLSLATAVLNVAAFGFCAYAIGVDLPALVVASIVPLILFAMVLPMSIGGWGLREGAAALLFPVVGFSASAGLAASVAFGVAFLLTILPGVILSWAAPRIPAFGRRSAR
nr:lysylphosphatidylglycerol synthase transmembrane domain-containing protein [Hasllibacter sp. MH4015]